MRLGEYNTFTFANQFRFVHLADLVRTLSKLPGWIEVSIDAKNTIGIILKYSNLLRNAFTYISKWIWKETEVYQTLMPRFVLKLNWQYDIGSSTFNCLQNKCQILGAWKLSILFLFDVVLLVAMIEGLQIIAIRLKFMIHKDFIYK